MAATPSHSIRILPSHPSISYQGRWKLPEYTCLWAGSTISFAFSGAFLYIVPGLSTVRRDSLNGGISALVWTIDGHEVKEARDLVPGQPLQLWSRSSSVQNPYRGIPNSSVRHEVEIVVSDWASQFQLGEIIVESLNDLHPPATSRGPPQVMFIGDSLTSGFAVSDRERGILSKGAYSAYPFAFKRHFSRAIKDLVVVGFPGIQMVSGYGWIGGRGMEYQFWRDSPWLDSEPWPLPLDVEDPAVIFICLGTNDAHGDVPVPTEKFIQHFLMFISALQGKFTRNLKHIAVISPFGQFETEDGARVGLQEPHLEKAILGLSKRSKESGSSVQIHFVETRGWLVSSALTMDGVHPTVQGHDHLGAKLAEWTIANGLLSPD